MIKKIESPLLRYGPLALIATLPLLLLWPIGFNRLLSSDGFLPHLYCYLEKPTLILLHVVSDSLIGFSYVAISGTLTYLVYRARKDIPFHWVFLAFGLFIVTCGLTHFMEVWTTLWTPVYWLAGNIKLVTALASVATAVVLPPLVPKTLALIQAAKISEERKLKLEQTNKELAELYTQLKELDQIKTQFFANVSHELRTPLTLVLGPTERLLESNRLSAQERHHLETIDRNARLLLKQVNDLLDLSKLEAGKMSADAVDADLARLVRFTAGHFESFAQESQITYTVETPETLSTRIDPEKIQRVLLNLLSNAFKFTPVGGKVRCLLRTQAGEALLTVQDSGPGVRPELRKAIFEPFRQGEGRAPRRFGGTGLGLSIAKEFVELHGGRITLGDAPIGGASFEVALPLVLSPAAAGTERRPESTEIPAWIEPSFSELRTTPARSENGGSEKNRPSLTLPLSSVKEDREGTPPLILIVEDNVEMNRFISDSLSPFYRVVSTFNGQEGLAQALALKPDLILSDIMMPELSGDRMIREIRAHAELDAVPIIFLTAKADDALSVRMLQQGAQDYLMKPFSIEGLRARVGNLIAMKQARELLQQELASQSQDLVGLVHEVSLRKRELQASQARFRRLVESNIIGVILADIGGQITDANQAFLDLIGYSREELAEGRINWRALTPPEYAARDRQRIEALSKTGKCPPFEKEYLRKDGSRVPVVIGVAMLDDSPNDTVAFVLDLTEQKRSEEALRKKTAEAEEANRLKSHFLSNVSHELRTPLNAIIGYTSLVLDETYGPLHPEQRPALQRIARNADDLVKLVTDLLDLTQIEAGKLSVEISRVDLRATAEEAVLGLLPLAQEKGLLLQWRIAKPLAPIESDPMKIKQILINLLSNAIKFTRKGEVVLEAKEAQEQGGVLIQVSDTGIGMREEDLPHIFDTFHQVDETFTREFGGVGLGLAIVKELVDLLGGEITVRSRYGEGSTFSLLLPYRRGTRANRVD